MSEAKPQALHADGFGTIFRGREVRIADVLLTTLLKPGIVHRTKA